MENIQEQEVLIARNNETGQVGAVVGQNPDGTPQMADAKTAKLSDLVKFNKGQRRSSRSEARRHTTDGRRKDCQVERPR